MPPLMKKIRIFVLLAVLLGGLYGLTACGVQALVYPGASIPMPDAEYGHEAQRVTIAAADGVPLRGWFFNRGAGSPLVAMYGGNAMSVGSFADIAAADTTRSYLLINYRGYGSSEGEPSEQALVADARHCLRYARLKLGGAPASVTLVGFSLGSGVATQVAAAENPDALVLICPFDSITNVACNMVPLLPRLLPLDSWRSVDYAPRIRSRVSILRATHDSIVPPAGTDALIRAFRATTPTVHAFPSDHNDIFTAPGFRETLHSCM